MTSGVAAAIVSRPVDTADSLTEVFAKLAVPEYLPRLLETMESPSGVDEELWGPLVARDLEPYFADAAAGEVAAMLEACGASLAPVPILGHHLLGRRLLGELGCRVTADRTLGDGHTVALAVPITEVLWRTADSGFTVRSGRLHGTVEYVVDAQSAQCLLVPAEGSLYLVDAGGPGVDTTQLTTLDISRRLSAITIDGVRGRLLSYDATPAIRATLTMALAALAAQQVGTAQRALATTVEHLNNRRQFGQVLGSLPSLQHRVAEIWVRATLARAAAHQAVDRALARADDAELAACTAFALCSRTAVLAAEESVQLHGARGLRWDYLPGLLLKRARTTAAYLGGVSAVRERAALLAGITLPDQS
ncbi:acyl-CoA dehydrogenase family protein [Nocardia niigatensis]|uniref:acyl-CoA dehydrogenase family protein n=1 Tax=Nocardia niigatensis TaxID=209249 RepID=UPI000306216B|nr:acyl-CoA dehydrogenase family protein [Nocardia niigatensis]